MAGDKVGKGALNMKKPALQKGEQNQVLEVIKITFEAIFTFLKCLVFMIEAMIRVVIPPPLKSVKGEIVLISGTGHGIGRELAFQYASNGATVICWDVNSKTNQETVDKIAQKGYPKAYSYVCDVSNRNQVIDTAKKVQKDVGDVSILINNAGIMPTHSLQDHSQTEIERIIGINVMAHFWTLQAFLPGMIKNNHGHIVTISSIAGQMGIKYLSPYCASKFAVRGMTEALYDELRMDPKCQIRTTTIYPYAVDTGLCKKPKLRFPNALGLLAPSNVANKIMKAQRRNYHEICIPRYYLSLLYIGRLLPPKVFLTILDFLDSYIDSDLTVD